MPEFYEDEQIRNEFFNVFDRYNLMFRCDFPDSIQRKIRNELSKYDDAQYRFLRNLYYDEYYNVDILTNKHDANKMKFENFMSLFLKDRVSLTITEFHSLLKNAESDEYILSSQTASSIIKNELRKFNFKLENEDWVKENISNIKDSIVNLNDEENPEIIEEVDIKIEYDAPLPEATCHISASKGVIVEGEGVQLIWKTENAKSFSINGIEKVNPKEGGKITVFPNETTEYTGIAEGQDGRKVMSTVRVIVHAHITPPPLPLLINYLNDIFKDNKLLSIDIKEMYSKYSSVHEKNYIENFLYIFIKDNNLISEKDTIKNEPKKDSHCATNWIKKPAIVFPPPGCGKYLGYGILLALIGVGIYYGLPLLNKGIVYYTISNDGANIRNSPNTLSKPNKKDAIAYGGRFKIKKETDVVSGEGGMWLKKDGLFSDKYGFAQIFVNEKDFYLLESIFGNETTKQAIKTVKCRKALIDYYKRQDPDYKFFGKINDITYKEVYKKPKDFTGEWQVFCEPYINGKPNSVFYEKVTRSNSEFTDFGFIVTNVSANIKRFVLYAFDDITEEPIYVGEADATGHNLVKYVTVRPNGTLNVNFAD
jgi:hypothetical protein